MLYSTENVWKEEYQTVNRHGLSLGVGGEGARALFYILLLLELAIENILFLKRETKKRVNYIFIQKND